MYKCDACGRISEPKEGCNIVPVQTRVKHYKEGTVGREIVKEQKMCNGYMEANSDSSEKQLCDIITKN